MCLSGFRLFSWAQIKEASFISQVSEWHSQLRCFSYWEEYQGDVFMFCAWWGTDFVSTSQNTEEQERLMRKAVLSWKAFDCIFLNPWPGSKEQNSVSHNLEISLSSQPSFTSDMDIEQTLYIAKRSVMELHMSTTLHKMSSNSFGEPRWPMAVLEMKHQRTTEYTLIFAWYCIYYIHVYHELIIACLVIKY